MQKWGCGIMVAAIVGVSLASAPAEGAAAFATSCTVTRVNYAPETLLTQCSINGTVGVYRAYGPDLTTNTCTRQSVDTLKVWVTMLQSALMSGRPVNIEYILPTDPGVTPACPSNLILNVELL